MNDSHNDTRATTQDVDSVSEIKKYAVIAGERVVLPLDAKFYFQDKRGLWFWSKRKPRLMEDDWTPNKTPVQVKTEKGFKRCLKTAPIDSYDKAWRETVTRAVNLDNRPLAMSPDLDVLPLAVGE